MAITTRIREIINHALAPIGFEVGTTVAKRIERERLNALNRKDHWGAERYTQGLSIDDEQCLEFLRKTCLPYRREYLTFEKDSNGSEQAFYLENGWFGSVDAEMLYSLIRLVGPRHIFEVGSGYSTRLMRRAIKDGLHKTRITSVDPNPNTSIAPFADKYIQQPIETIPIEQISGDLDANDILFIDSSHQVKTGGDVPYLFLEVLPRLKPGVFVHIHDIFFPFDYPRKWVFDGWDWNEQYLVHAFLCYNDRFAVRWSSSYMWQRHRDEILSVIPSAQTFTGTPCSLWLQKCNNTA